ncbi:hypothetical protein LVJ94_08755 [Pendulispora rubella]|uniref:L-2-amino-thiazoline-4-carboxylic acid hydrolase n=1 Tax=Pendulispora rubella TaxID=2741070 RepID=A0ABZ2L979_9BACT
MSIAKFPARPTEEVPRMRAGQLHEALALIDELPPPVARAIRAKYNAKYLQEIEQATRLTWIPIEYGVEMAVAYHEVLGEKDTFLWGRATMLRVTEKPWIRHLRDTAVRLFGLTPKGLYRFAPRFWDAVYSHSGELVCVPRAEGAVTIVLNNIPRAMIEAHGHLITMSGAFAAALEFCEVRGDVWLRPVVAGDNRCTYDVIWSERKTAVSQ